MKEYFNELIKFFFFFLQPLNLVVCQRSSGRRLRMKWGSIEHRWEQHQKPHQTAVFLSIKHQAVRINITLTTAGQYSRRNSIENSHFNIITFSFKYSYGLFFRPPPPSISHMSRTLIFTMNHWLEFSLRTIDVYSYIWQLIVPFSGKKKPLCENWYGYEGAASHVPIDSHTLASPLYSKRMASMPLI